MTRKVVISPSRRLLAASVVLTLTISSAAWGQVIPDGGTATTVTSDPTNGAAIVQIAPVANQSAISHNTYSEFSVAPAGVDLDNRAVNARTILNEVTSSKISVLAGPTEVLGPRAHVMIANPNGIVVDGASFINTGGVVLSTGKPSIASRPVTGGLTQDNIVLETAGGRVDVRAGGLSGAMTSLQMIAGQIGVDGPVENTSSNLRSDVRLIAGGSSVEYDSAVLPISDLEDWGRVADKGVDDDGIAVEITSRGSLKASTVRIRATNKGAGVTHSGQGLASLGDFAIDASGKVTTTGSVKATKNLRIKAASLQSSSAAGAPQQTIEAIDGALTVLATSGSIENTGVLMSGSRRDAGDSESAGAVTMRASGDISLLTENADQLAIVFAANGDLVAEAGGDIVNNTGRLLSNSAAVLKAGGEVENITDIQGGTGSWTREVTYGSRLWFTLWQSREKVERISVDYGDPRIDAQQAYIVGSSVSIAAGGAVTNRASTINANDGSVRIDGQSIVNEGGMSGSLEFVKRCRLTCIGYGSSTATVIGGAINAAGAIDLVARDSIVNRGGQLVSYGDIRMNAPAVSLSAAIVPTVAARPPGLYNFWQGSSAWIGTSAVGGLLVAPAGKIEIASFAPVEVDAGVLDARDGVIVHAGQEIVSAPGVAYPFGRTSIGLFREMTGE